MSDKKAEKAEKEITEKIIKKVNKIYQNYGIDPDGLDEGDINRVYKYYSNNLEKLEKDLRSSEGNSRVFSEEDYI